MQKIICCTKKCFKQIALPCATLKVNNIKQIINHPECPIIFSSSFLSKIKPSEFEQLANRICLVYFNSEDDHNLVLVEKYQLFDYLTEKDTPKRMLFKLSRACQISEAKVRIDTLRHRLFKKERQLNEFILIDPLAGCYNWRYFLHRTHQELSRARRHIYNVSFIAVDIDYFRRINEVYSVKVGDILIKEIVKILKDVLRREDVITRWREDEFFIISPYLSRKNALKVASRIKSRISKHKFCYGSLKVKLKVSLGVLAFPEDVISNTKDVVNALEKCLVSAKRKGGDVITVYSYPQAYKIEKIRHHPSLKELRAKLDKMNTVLARDVLDMIYGFARTIELKDAYTGEHVEYTSAIAEAIARELKLPDTEIENVKFAGVLHDLGKVGIDENILSKRGPLSNKEREVIKAHPWIATEILREIHALVGAIPAVLYHHERFDGKGYPLGLKGEEIPLSARIVAVADVYQALISNRPYRRAFTRQQALALIKKDAGKSFDPSLVNIFCRVIKKLGNNEFEKR